MHCVIGGSLLSYLQRNRDALVLTGDEIDEVFRLIMECCYDYILSV